MKVTRRPLNPKPKTKAKPRNVDQAALFEFDFSPEVMLFLKALTDIKPSWRGTQAIPPGSLLSVVLKTFELRTDIPLELPHSATMAFVSGELLRRQVKLSINGQVMRPDIWTIALAESGAGKTITTSFLKKAFDIDDSQLFGDFQSAAKFADELRSSNHRLWIRDEFAQFLAAMEQQTYMAEIKDYLLRVYDNSTVTRKLKNDAIVIPDAALTIFGTTVFSTFKDKVTTESMLDGFAQRFGYVIAREDSSRPMQDYAFYDLEPMRNEINKRWIDVSRTITDDATYVITDDAMDAYKQDFQLLFTHDVPASFYRRIMFRAFKTALLYHVILLKPSLEIDAQDIEWAMRATKLQLIDLRDMIGERELSALERKFNKVEDLIQRYKEQGREITPRDLIRHINSIGTAQEAKNILSVIK